MLVANYYPDRITVTRKREFTHTERMDQWVSSRTKTRTKSIPEACLDNLKVKKTSIDLSANSIRQLRNSVNSLVFLSKPRTIFRKNRKPIYNFRASFITLTLPSEQKHSDTEIKQCLNLLLTDLRRVYGLQNYVWRSELQKNGNVHFHLVIDIYIDWKVLRNYWLKSLRSLGYIKAYQSKFTGMSFADYFNLRLQTHQGDSSSLSEFRNQCAKAYTEGKRNNWLTPNCVDVRSVFNVNQMAAYVAKYMAKSGTQAGNNDPANLIDEAQQKRFSEFGKVWARSTSLSRLKYIFPYAFDSSKPFIDSLVQAKAVVTKVYDYATVHYFVFDKMPKKLLSHIQRVIFNLAATWNYPLVPV